MRRTVSRTAASLAIALTCAVASIGRVTPAAYATDPPVTRWPVGVTEAKLPPIARPALAARAILDDGDLFVFGGGNMGEGVSKPDGHADAARFDFGTKRWSRLAPAPVGLTNVSALTVGDHVVALGLVPRCVTEVGLRQCRSGRPVALSYDVDQDSWRRITLPSALQRTSVGSRAVLADARAAYFFMSAGLVRFTPKGDVTVVTPDVPLDGAEGCTIGSHAYSLDQVSARLGQAPVVVDLDVRTGATRTLPPVSVNAPTPQAILRCTETAVAILGLFVNVWSAASYDVTTGVWTSIDAPPLPSVAGTCTTGVYPCNPLFSSGHGDHLDVWYAGRDPGAQFDVNTRVWASTTAGPDLSVGSAVSRSDVVQWSGELGAVIARGDGDAGPDGGFLVYRPR